MKDSVEEDLKKHKKPKKEPNLIAIKSLFKIKIRLKTPLE